MGKDEAGYHAGVFALGEVAGGGNDDAPIAGGEVLAGALCGLR